MTARDIQHRLILDRYARSFILPNYTPAGWFECDVFEVTKAGLFTEFEIKLTLPDYLADGKKEKSGWRWNEQTLRGETFSLGTKHQRLAAVDALAPSRFWFVCPDGVVPVGQIPDWAGLLYAHQSERTVYLGTVKPAPKLHRLKFDPKRLEHARSVCYYRMHHLWLKRNPSLETTTSSLAKA